MSDQKDTKGTGLTRRRVVKIAGSTALLGGAAVTGSATAQNACVSLNDADSSELQQLRHVDNEEEGQAIIDARPFRNVNHLLQVREALSLWDPRMLAEMVKSGVCEYDTNPVDRNVDGPPFPKVDGVAYSQGRVGRRHGGSDYAHDIGGKVTFAGFERGGTTVADFTVFTTTEQNWNLNWDLWMQQPHKTITLPIKVPEE